jgi:peptidoglycan hydrolase-like protein with peptidoglycan-binding domain
VQADGIMGPKTQAALKEFQEKQGIQASGQLDQKTLAALGVSEGASASTGSSASTGASAEKSGASAEKSGAGSSQESSSGASSQGSSGGASAEPKSESKEKSKY